MKKPATLILSALLCFNLAISPAALAQEAGDIPKLTGIARIGDRECVVLEIPLRLGRGALAYETRIFHAGERQSAVEVKSISLSDAAVELVYHGSNVLVRLSGMKPNAIAHNQIEFTNAASPQGLLILSELSGRTILEHPALAPTNLILSATAGSHALLATLLSAALTNVGIVNIADGDKFLRIVPAAIAGEIQSQLPIVIRTTNELTTADELYPPGTINYTGAKGSQVAKLYAELAGKKLDQTSQPPHMPDFRWRNHQSLTRGEILYALDVQFSWRGVKFMAVDDEMIRVVRLNEP